MKHPKATKGSVLLACVKKYTVLATLSVFVFFKCGFSDAAKNKANIFIYADADISSPYIKNTLSFYRWLIENEVNAVSIDVAATKDGSLVAYDSLQLKNNQIKDSQGNWLRGKVLLRDINLQKLQTYTVVQNRTAISQDDDVGLTSKPESYIPSIEEVLIEVKDLVPSGDLAFRFHIVTSNHEDGSSSDLKNMASALHKVINDHGIQEYSEVTCDNHEFIGYLQELSSDIKIIYAASSVIFGDSRECQIDRDMKKKSHLLNIIKHNLDGDTGEDIPLLNYRQRNADINYLPEKTLYDYKKALFGGLTSVSASVSMTKDGQLVVSRSLFMNENYASGEQRKKAPNANAFKNMTMDEIRSYNVGYVSEDAPILKFFNVNASRPKNLQMITLQELIDFIKAEGDGSVLLKIEAITNPDLPSVSASSDDMAKAIGNIVRKNKITQSSEVSAFEWQVLKKISAINPKIKTVYLYDSEVIDNYEKTSKVELSQQMWMYPINLKDYNFNYTKAFGAVGGIKEPLGKASEETAYGFDLKDNGDAKVKPFALSSLVSAADGKMCPGVIKELGGSVWAVDIDSIEKKDITKAKKQKIKVVIANLETFNEYDHVDKLANLFKWGVEGIIAKKPKDLRSFLVSKGLC